MANKMIDVNRHLFERLEKQIPSDTAIESKLVIGEKSIRYIGTTKGSYAQSIIKNGQVSDVVKTVDKSTILVINFDNRTFLVITGNIDGADEFLKGITTVVDLDNEEQDFKFNPGLATLLFANDNFPLDVDSEKSYQLIEYVFTEEKEGISNGNFNYTELAHYFSNYDVWEVSEKYLPLNQNSIVAIYSGYLINYNKEINLEFSPNTKQTIKLLIEELPIDLVGGNIYRALTAMEWKHSFLELYQCIEYLFPLPYLINLSNNIGNKSLLPKLFFNTENDLQWRPKEDQALIKLLKQIENESSFTQILNSLINILKTKPDNTDNNCIFVSKHIYNTRNSIAHFRSGITNSIKTNSEWDEIIEKLSLIIHDLYKVYSSEISLIK